MWWIPVAILFVIGMGAWVVLVTTSVSRWWRVKWLLDWLLVLSVPRWWYSWRHAAHVIEQTAAEYGPATFYGSMDVTAEQALYHELPWWPAPTVDPEPWRERMTAELSPEALDDDDPGPGDGHSSLDSPGPDQDAGDDGVNVRPWSGHGPLPSSPAQPSRWLAEQLDILYTWSDWQQQKAAILA